MAKTPSQHDLRTAEARLLHRAELVMLVRRTPLEAKSARHFLRIMPDLIDSVPKRVRKPSLLGAFASLVPRLPDELLQEAASKEARTAQKQTRQRKRARKAKVV